MGTRHQARKKRVGEIVMRGAGGVVSLELAETSKISALNLHQLPARQPSAHPNKRPQITIRTARHQQQQKVEWEIVIMLEMLSN